MPNGVATQSSAPSSSPTAGSMSSRRSSARMITGTSVRDRMSQQVEPVVLAETQVEDRQVRLAQGEMAYHCLASRRAQSAHLVSLEIVHDHLPRDGVVNGDEDERR